MTCICSPHFYHKNTENIFNHFLLGLNHFGTLDPSLLSTLEDWLILGTLDSSGILSIDLLPSLLKCNLNSFNLITLLCDRNERIVVDSRHYLKCSTAAAPGSSSIVLTLSAPSLLLAWLAAVLAPLMLMRLVTASSVRSGYLGPGHETRPNLSMMKFNKQRELNHVFIVSNTLI